VHVRANHVRNLRRSDDIGKGGQVDILDDVAQRRQIEPVPVEEFALDQPERVIAIDGGHAEADRLVPQSNDDTLGFDGGYTNVIQ
jgi:hypothetical protein